MMLGAALLLVALQAKIVGHDDKRANNGGVL